MEKKSPIIVAFANHKGGVGKTTTTASVGSILATKGLKVLVVDLDAQSNLTGSLYKGEVETSVYHALKNECDLPILKISNNLDLAPASLQLAMADIELASVISRERMLSEILEPIKHNYDFILIDCPPSLGLMTLNAFTCCNGIILPLTAQVLPFKGLKMILKFVDTVKRRLNPGITVYGILLTQWENTKLSNEIEKNLREGFSGVFNTFKTRIRKNVTIAEAPLEAKNIVEYAPKSNGAADYKNFTQEFIELFDSMFFY